MSEIEAALIGRTPDYRFSVAIGRDHVQVAHEAARMPTDAERRQIAGALYLAANAILAGDMPKPAYELKSADARWTGDG